MNTREKRLMGLLVIVVIYAVGDYGYSYFFSGKSGAQQNPEAEQLAEANRAVNEVSSRLAALPVKAAQQHILVQAEKKITVDPLRAIDKLKKGEFDPANLPAVRFSGYIRVGDQSIVIVNGAQYRLGDMIRMTEEKIVAIDSEKITLRHIPSGHERTITSQVQKAAQKIEPKQ